MSLRLRVWLRRRSQRSLLGLSVGGLLALLLIGGGVYAVLGGVGKTGSTSDIELQRGLVGWWKLDGNTVDSTPYTNNGTISGGVTPTTDREGASSKAMAFDGTSGFINVPDAAPLDPTAAITVSAWVKAGSLSAFTGIVSKDISGAISNPPYVLETTGSGNQISFAVDNAANTNHQISSGSLTVGTWYLITGTLDGTNMNLYVNGSFVTSTAQTDVAATTGSLKIGQQKTGFSRFFNGSVDDVRIYNRALPAAEITALYQQYNPSLNLASGENGLVGWWNLDGNGIDSTPYADNCTVSGATATTDRKGATNAALSFDGNTQYVSCPDATQLDTGSMTTSFWLDLSSVIDCDGNNNYRALIGKGIAGSGSTSGWDVVLEENMKVQFDIGYGGVSHRSGSINVGMAVGTPIFLTFTYDAGTGTRDVYANGVLVNTATIAATPITTVTNPFVISKGSNTGTCPNGGGYVPGSYDDVRLYNGALSAAQITNLYNSYNSRINLNSSPTNGLTNNLNAGLVAYWPFNGNARDATPYSENGTLTGSPTLTNDTKGRANRAYSFNSTAGQYILVPTTKLPTTAITVSVWVNQSTLANWYNLVYNQWGVNGGWLLFTDSSGVAMFGVYNTGTQHNATCSAGAFTSGAWHLLTGTYDGSTVKVYLDGAVCPTTASVTATLAYSASVQIGNSQTSGSTHSIDDVRIYNRALSSSEVQQLQTSYY